MSNYHKPSNIIPPNDLARLDKLERYDILDTPSEISFDTIASIAAEVFGAPGAFVNFVDKDRVYFKANLSSMAANEVDRQDSLCSLTILQHDITVFNDTHAVTGLLESPYVAASGGIRFYAGAPITTIEGYNIGTVCVIDDKPRTDVPDGQLRILRSLAILVLEKLESRLVSIQSIRTHDDRLHQLAHDMKNPTTAILGYSQLLNRPEVSRDLVLNIGNKIERAARGIEQNLNNLLSEAVNDHHKISLNFESVSVKDLFDYLLATFELALKNKSQRLTIVCDNDHLLLVDKQRIQDVLSNLLSNAIKYSHLNTEIQLLCVGSKEELTFEFRDQGVGLTKEDLKKVFTKFAKLSSVPTARERSSGLGLYIVKTLVQLHGGKAWATSNGKDKGSSFFISLPKKIRSS